MSETTVLIRRAQSGEKEAREVLIEENLGLVHHIVKRFAGRGYEMEDLFQIGVIGLMKAVDKFNTSFEVKFSTYAVPLISGEIKRFLRDDGMVKVSRTLKENGMRVKYARERLYKEKGREPSLEEVAREAALTVEEVVLSMEATIQVESIYRCVYQNDGSEICLADQLADDRKDEQEMLLNHMVIGQLLDGLPDKEKQLIRLRYYQDKTQTEVAKMMGISQVQVSRMEKKILLGMRKKIQDEK